MSCKKLAIFFGLLLSFVFSSLLVSSSYATSVDCTINKDSVTSSIREFTQFYPSSYSLSDVCPNFSSLDSSKDWYFTLDIHLLKEIPDQVFIAAWGEPSPYSNLVLYQYPNFRLLTLSRYQRPIDSSIFSIISTSNAIKPHTISLSGNYFVNDYYTISLSISDEKPSFSSNIPTGNIDITSNGTYDVTQYASATVNVPQEISTTPYDEKLDQIIKAIYVCAGTMLVIYFFYCIYRMILKKGGT